MEIRGPARPATGRAAPDNFLRSLSIEIAEMAVEREAPLKPGDRGGG